MEETKHRRESGEVSSSVRRALLVCRADRAGKSCIGKRGTWSLSRSESMLKVAGRADEVYVVMTPYASGAIGFHFPAETVRRGARRGGSKIHRFSIPVPSPTVIEGGRRGFITSAIDSSLQFSFL